MAQDVYVMPLWRFKSGDFQSPIEDALGIVPTIIVPSALPPEPPPPWYMQLLAMIGLIEIYVQKPAEQTDPAVLRSNAAAEVQALKAELSRQAGKAIDWEDKGPVRYSKQFHGSFFLRSFAAWHDHREELPEFLASPSLPEQHGERYPVWDLPKPAARRFPTLVEHSLHTGYFIPAEFDGVLKIEPFKAYGHWDMHHDAASTAAALRELRDLRTSIAELKAQGGSEEHTKYLETADYWTRTLHEILTLSAEHGVPVIFWG